MLPDLVRWQGMLPLVGYNYGARKKERVGEVVIKTGVSGFIWGAVCWVAAMLFSTQVMSLFSTDLTFLAAAAPAFRVFALGFFTVGLQTILTFFFQGIGKGLPSLALASTRQIIFLIPAILILPRLFGMTGLWLAFPTADILSVVVTITWTIVEFRRQGIPWRLRGAQPLAYAATGSKIERP